MKNLILFLFLFISTGIQAQKMIHELPAKTNVDSTNWLFLTGNPTSGKLYKITAANLRDSVYPATDTTSLSSRINLKLNATDTVSLSTRIDSKLSATDTASLSNRIDGKQATLVSGTNLKTVNGSTLLGSGDLVVAGGGSDTTSLSNRIDLLQNRESIIYAEDYGAKGDGEEYFDGAITASTNILTSATAGFILSDVGKCIRVGGAGAAGVELLTTISGFTNSTTVTLTDNAATTVSGKRIFFGTDNTSPIQNAINAALTGRGGMTVYFKEGIFCIAGVPVTSGSNPNSQIYIPLTSYSPSLSQKSIKLLGAAPTTWFLDFAENQRPTNTGTILHSMRNDAGAALLGSESEVAIYGTFNWVSVYIENMVFRTVSLNGLTDIQPKMSGIDAHRMNMVNLFNVKVETESITIHSLEPDSSAIGVYLPLNNNGGDIYLNHVQVAKYFIGIKSNENLVGDQIWIYSCNTGIEFTEGYHDSHVNKMMLHWSINQIKVTGAAYFKIDNLDLEDYPVSVDAKWFNTVYSLDDADGTGKGDITYHRVVAKVGINNAGFTRSDPAQADNYLAHPIGTLHSDFADITFTGTLINNNNNTTGYQVRTGTFLMQSYSLNNGFLTDNGYYNGSTWTRVADGYVSGFQFFNGQLVIHSNNTGSGNFTQAIQLKSDYSGKFGLGTNIPISLSDFTGSTFFHDAATGETGMGTVNPNEILHIYKNANSLALMQFENPNAGSGAAAGIKITSNGGDSYIYRTSTSYSPNPDMTAIQDAGGGGIGLYTGSGNLSLYTYDGSVSIGSTTIAASSVLDVQSTTKGFLPPRMTAAQAGSISSPAEGLLVYVTDTDGTFTAKGWWGWEGSSWAKLNN